MNTELGHRLADQAESGDPKKGVNLMTDHTLKKSCEGAGVNGGTEEAL